MDLNFGLEERWERVVSIYLIYGREGTRCLSERFGLNFFLLISIENRDRIERNFWRRNSRTSWNGKRKKQRRKENISVKRRNYSFARDLCFWGRMFPLAWRKIWRKRFALGWNAKQDKIVAERFAVRNFRAYSFHPFVKLFDSFPCNPFPPIVLLFSLHHFFSQSHGPS